MIPNCILNLGNSKADADCGLPITLNDVNALMQMKSNEQFEEFVKKLPNDNVCLFWLINFA